MRSRTAVLVAGLGLTAAIAAWVPATPALAQQTASPLCLPLVLNCPSPSPDPSPSPGSSSPGGSGGVLGPVLGPLLGGTDGAGTGPTLPAIPLTLDPDAPVFTQPAAQMGAASLHFSGLHSVDVVLVRTVDGGEVPVIRVLADVVVVDGFLLDVRREAGGPAAVNTSDRMEVRGHVRIYLQSLTATLPGGLGISLLAPTPPPGDELPPTLLRATFGLVGVTADTSVWTHTDLRMHADA